MGRLRLPRNLNARTAPGSSRTKQFGGHFDDIPARSIEIERGDPGSRRCFPHCGCAQIQPGGIKLPQAARERPATSFQYAQTHPRSRPTHHRRRAQGPRSSRARVDDQRQAAILCALHHAGNRALLVHRDSLVAERAHACSVDSAEWRCGTRFARV